MSRMLTAPDPAVFSADVLAFAAERGVTDYLAAVHELTRKCFPGVDIWVSQDNDYEIPDLGWIVYEIGVAGWDFGRYRAAKERWLDEIRNLVPPAVRQPFVLRMR